MDLLLTPLTAVAAEQLPPGLSEVVARAALDVVAMTVLTVGLFLPRHRRRDLVTVYWLLNAALFCVLLVIGGGQVGVGAGLGLFAVLSIVRLRSEQYDNVEIGYFFVALALALVAGLAPTVPVALALTVGLLLVVAVVDLARLLPGPSATEVVLDVVLECDLDLRMELGRRLGGLVVDVDVVQVDYVRSSMLVSVRYRPLPVRADAVPS